MSVGQPDQLSLFRALEPGMGDHITKIVSTG